MRKNKNIFLIVTVAFVIILFSINTTTILASITHSLKLCASSVIPALFPFFVLSEFLISLVAGTGANPTVFALICGMMTGFPTGTKNVCSLYRENKIDKKTATALLYCTANASPAYIVSFIGVCMIGSKNAGIILLVSQCICALVCFFALKGYKKTPKNHYSVINLTDVACSAINGSVTGCLNVCGYIIFMGAIADIVIQYKIPDLFAKIFFYLPENCVKAVVIGFFEISRGIEAVDFSKSYAVVTSAVIIGFSGVSIILQCINCANDVNLPKLPILKGKLIYAFTMPFIAYTLSDLFPISFYKPSKMFGKTIFLIFILFFAVFLYIIFDKSFKKLYNRKKA